jgi:hypothetical protein
VEVAADKVSFIRTPGSTVCTVPQPSPKKPPPLPILVMSSQPQSARNAVKSNALLDSPCFCAVERLELGPLPPGPWSDARFRKFVLTAGHSSATPQR